MNTINQTRTTAPSPRLGLRSLVLFAVLVNAGTAAAQEYPTVGGAIAAQGNAALTTIRAETTRLAAPSLPAFNSDLVRKGTDAGLRAQIRSQGEAAGRDIRADATRVALPDLRQVRVIRQVASGLAPTVAN